MPKLPVDVFKAKSIGGPDLPIYQDYVNVGGPDLPIRQTPIDALKGYAASIPTQDDRPPSERSGLGLAIDRLLGTGGQQRYQLWPERLVREGISAPHDVMNSPPMNSEDMIPQAMAMSALAGSGGLAGAGEEAGAALGAGPFLRPALKYGDRLYKAKKTMAEGGEHYDAIPPDLHSTFQKQAMSGEDLSNFNFGFMNHKGHFLSREDALKYAIDEGLIDAQAAQYGTLTSTMMADSSKPGTAIEAAKSYPLAKPTDRWSNTLGQNDKLIENMTPDEFINKSRPLKVDAESRENINDLKQHMQEGKPLDPLELHANGKEDGRHRAIAAKELGIKEIPVINFRNKQ